MSTDTERRDGSQILGAGSCRQDDAYQAKAQDDFDGERLTAAEPTRQLPSPVDLVSANATGAGRVSCRPAKVRPDDDVGAAYSSPLERVVVMDGMTNPGRLKRLAALKTTFSPDAETHVCHLTGGDMFTSVVRSVVNFGFVDFEPGVLTRPRLRGRVRCPRQICKSRIQWGVQVRGNSG